MTKLSTPHTQSQQNIPLEQTDLEPDQDLFEAEAEAKSDSARRLQGGQTGESRSHRKVAVRSRRRNTEPETSAHEGGTTTRTPKGTGQGITAHSADEESARQEKVVKDRPDGQAGINHSRK